MEMICLAYANSVQRGPFVPGNPIPFVGFDPAAGTGGGGRGGNNGDGDADEDEDEDEEDEDDEEQEESSSIDAFESV